MCGRYDLTDFEWSIIEPLPPNVTKRRSFGAGADFGYVPQANLRIHDLTAPSRTLARPTKRFLRMAYQEEENSRPSPQPPPNTQK